MLFDVAKDGHKIAPKTVPPIEEQEPNESRRYVPASPRFRCAKSEQCTRLWSALTEAIHLKDMEKATTSKTAVEDAQRERRRRMEEHGETHVPKYFELKNDHWVPKITYFLSVYSPIFF